MKKLPRHVEGAPRLSDLLRGMPPHRNSHARQIQVELLSICPSVFDGGREIMLAQCGGSPPFYELVRGLWKASIHCTGDKANPAGADIRFRDSLYEAGEVLERITRAHTAVDADLDLGLEDGPELDIYDVSETLLADMGDQKARQAFPAIAWRHARRQTGVDDDFLYSAVGASLYADQPWRFREWHPAGGPTGFVATCIELGRQAFKGKLAPAEPAWATQAKATAGLRAIEAARADDGPSLMVLVTTDHLPGSAASGEGRPGGSVGTTARAEWAPMAGKKLPLVVVPDLARVKRCLVKEFLDCERIIDAVLAPLAGRSFAYLSPFLLVGAPGSGKSRLARRIGEELGLAVTIYSCAGVSDAAFGGTSRQWSTGRACVPLQAIRRAGAASVLIVLDEIARAGTRVDSGRLTDSVLNFTERGTAQAYQDPYLECPVDLSAVSYGATANTLDGLDPALLSRFRVYEMPLPTARSLPVLAKAIVAEMRIERGLDERWLPDLTPEEADMIGGHWSGGSVRILQQLVEVAVNGRDLGPAN